MRWPEKVQLQIAFGFGSIPCKKSRQRPEMYPEKTFRPDNLRLPFHTDREAPQATRCDDPKKYSSRQLSALGRYPAKSPTSLRNCALKRRSGQAASGFGSILSKKPRQPSEIYPGKNIHAGLPSTFGQSPAKSPVSLRRYAPKKRSGQRAFGFWSILCKKFRQPSEMYPSYSFRAVGFRL